MFFLYYHRVAGIPPHALLGAYANYSEGFYGYSEAKLTNFNNVGQRCVAGELRLDRSEAD